MHKPTLANPVTHFFLKVGRRLRRRVEIDAEVRATIISTRDGRRADREIIGRTVNLSHAGALIILPEVAANDFTLSAEPGEGVTNLLEMDVRVGDRDPTCFSALAKVVWLEEIRKGGRNRHYFLAGIRFVKLYRRDQEILGQILGA